MHSAKAPNHFEKQGADFAQCLIAKLSEPVVFTASYWHAGLQHPEAVNRTTGLEVF